MRRGFYQLRGLFHFFGDGAHGGDEQVEFLKRFALRGLDHQGAVDDHGEADRVGVEAVVDEALGDVAGLNPFGRLALVAEDDFVHRGRFVRQLVEVFELLALARM